MTGPGGPPAGVQQSAALLTDLYQLTMAQSYVDEGADGRPATFSAFVRHLPAGWGYLVAAGLDDVLHLLESFAFTSGDLAALADTGLFHSRFLERLAGLRFEGEVRAMPEGTLFFPDEPLLELRAPLIQVQLVETAVLNELHVQSLVAAKAARFADVADGRTLIDFGLRRAHGTAAGLRVARSSFLAGFAATSNVLAGGLYGIPLAGTMSHAYVESHDDELEAFRAFARSFPDGSILLVDTYDTLEGARRAAIVGRELAEGGHRLAGVRLDSGELGAVSREVRSILDSAGLDDAVIVASGGLDERAVAELVAGAAPIDSFGVGTQLATPADAPSLEMVVKLVELAGRPTLKLSPGKATMPGPKQVWRVSLREQFAYDTVTPVAGPAPPGAEPLLELVMAGGRRLVSGTLAEARDRCAEQRARLAAGHRALEADAYEVRFSDGLLDLRDRLASGFRERTGEMIDP